MKQAVFVLAFASLALLPFRADAQADKSKPGVKKAEEKKAEEKKAKWSPDTFSGLAFRSLGPALTSGRIIDIAVDATRPSTWFVAAASGGVWKTTNAGTTFTPVFDGEGSYSIGCVAIDPNDSSVVWVGTGENNSQRSVAYGDGVYRSEDGGKSWTNVGLKESQHIGKILVDPRDSNVVWVAAQGPLWNAGGERGLYKTTDGGKTWKAALTISENTGVSDIAFDPRDPDTIYATAYQRRRHVWTLIDGGPESGIHKSSDGGASWKKLTTGLPKEEMGRIGIVVSPIEPDIVYALVEAANKAGGTFRSADRGATWEKRGDYVSGGPQYYQELFADPAQLERIYSMDTYLKVSDDGGKSWRNLGEKSKHVDNHAMWIDPRDTRHYLVGCDGGLYESFDRGETWKYFPNLPITQFYRVHVDNREPFYFVYGGTQDNFSLGGPSRNLTLNGIANAEWFVTQGGDGFWTVTDPTNPDIIYAEYQHGGLTRYDRKSGEAVAIAPIEGKGEEALRWNWDSPLIVSPHSPTRLYFAANRVYRSDDRGDSWRAVSPDLTRRLDRNKLKVMGRVWSVDAVAKNTSTSFYGNIVALSESPKAEGLLYVGTDDGLVQVSEDGGANWRKVERFTGVPDTTFVADLEASRHAADTLYAAFDNHKMGDFKPYLLKSADRGRTWSSIAGDLPARGTIYTVAEDPGDPNLLFAGSEFGVHFSSDGGKKWLRLKGGLPTIQVRDLAIHQREKDLVLGTFGRGFYVLDDYTPLRGLAEASLEKEAILFSTPPALAYIEKSDLGLRGKSFQGESFYLAPNPEFGSTFTYYLKDSLKTKKKTRQEMEKDLVKENKDVYYPEWEALRAEAIEEDPKVLLTIRDSDGNIVRRITGSTEAGVHRVSWDLRHATSTPTQLKPPELDLFDSPDVGPMAVPGIYTVSLEKRGDGKETQLAAAQTFEVVPLGVATLPAADRGALLDFQRKTARLQRAVLGAVETIGEAQKRIDHLKKAIDDTPSADPAWAGEARGIEARLRDVRRALEGDRLLAQRNEPTPPPIVGRVQTIVGTQWMATAAATGTSLEQYRVAGEEFALELEKLRVLVEKDLAALESKLEAAGGPWTPGRVPRWKPE